MNGTADACNAAHRLLKDPTIELERADLVGSSVRSVREICTRAQANVDRIVKTAKKTKRPAEEVEEAKKQIGKAVTKTAKESRRGEVALEILTWPFLAVLLSPV